MQKEKLTLSHIRQDIRSAKKEHIGYLVLYSVLLAFLSGVFIVGFIVAPGEFFLEIPIVLIADGVLIYKIVRHACDLATLSSNTPIEERIAQDTLVNATFVDRWTGNTPKGRYRFRFARYGDHTVPTKNYTWSAAFSMSDEGVFNYAVNGDAFYLVLSKPHAGKILLAYNAKLFELEE